MPQHPCPCNFFNLDNGDAYAFGTGEAADVASAVTLAENAQLAQVLSQANGLAQGHTCAAGGCVLTGRITWNRAQRGWLLIGANPDGAGGIVFRVLSFGRFTRAAQVPAAPAGPRGGDRRGHRLGDQARAVTHAERAGRTCFHARTGLTPR
jgi:hypothetical protein